MSEAQSLVRQGRVREALPCLQGEIRSKPADPSLRVFLFHLLALLGDWERCRKQLEVLAKLGREDNLIRVFDQLLDAETERARTTTGEVLPELMGEPEEWMASYLIGSQLAFRGETTPARALWERSLEQMPPVRGSINGKAFEFFGDADVRFGPFLEAVIWGRYRWVPWQRIREIRCEAPDHLSDFVWLPAQFIWDNGGEVSGFIPVRYPGTLQQSNEALLLARATEWEDAGDGLQWGLGQRMFTDLGEDFPLLDTREWTLAGGDA